MSLFNETVKRVAELERENAELHKRLDAAKQLISNLESMAQHARRDARQGLSSKPGKMGWQLPPPDVTALSEDEVETAMSHAFAPNDEQIAPPSTPWRPSRVFAPLCALFTRKPSQTV